MQINGGAYMLPKFILEKALEIALKNGADFSEIFLEDTLKNNITMTNDKMEAVISGRSYGYGIRAFSGVKSVYAFSSVVTERAIYELAKEVALALKSTEEKIDKTIVLNKKELIDNHEIIFYPTMVEAKKKADIVTEAYKAIKSYDAQIVQANVTYLDEDRSITVVNSEGVFAEDRAVRTRLAMNAIAGDGNQNQTGTESPGRRMGFEMFEKVDYISLAKSAARTALTMLSADECPSGVMPVVIGNGFGGVIFHEACGHALEATAVAKGNSVFAGKIGEKIANEKVTAIDDGTLKNEWGSNNIDDEGTNTHKNVLIENGILKSYLVDKLGSRRMGLEPNGCSRRQSYKFAPTSRMSNTFIAPGIDENDDILASVTNGLYAKKMGGGSVNPVTGEFNFAVQEGYILKNGKIDRPVRGATLIGKGSEVLPYIDMIGKNLALAEGMCGSVSGSIPTCVGQPMIRVSSMTVGGREAK